MKSHKNLVLSRSKQTANFVIFFRICRFWISCLVWWTSYTYVVDSYQSKTEIQHWMPMKGIYPSHQYIWGPPEHCQLFQYSSKLIKLPWPKRIFSNYFHNQLHTSHPELRHWVEIWSILELFLYYLCLHTNLLGIPGSM